MKKCVNLGIIGLGSRAETLLPTLRTFSKEECVITAICDTNPARQQKFKKIFEAHKDLIPMIFTDYKELLASDQVDAVLVPTSWNSHLAIASEAMKYGKYAGIEVGGASSIDELWQLIHNAESTGTSCMMLENCCYGRDELLVLNMERQGLFGEIVHCACGYEHYIAEMIDRTGCKDERAVHNLKRNCDLYPTHGIGPVAKLLRINRGNRFLTISSTASKACGFDAYAREVGAPVSGFAMGDVITSVIKCANGETITVTHGISLPRPYSRDGRVQGTKGIWLEDKNGIYIHGVSECKLEFDLAGLPYHTHKWTPIEKFYEKYEHPIWKDFRNNPEGGHGGMDTLTLRAFVEAVRTHAEPPINVYDCAAWMAVTALSEISIATGGMPVPFPDFTNGKWIYRNDDAPSKWSLDNVYKG